MFGDRNRSGTYVIMLSLAAAMFGMFFFIVLFVQNVLGYSPIQAGLAFLPVTAAIGIGAGLSQRFLPVLGPKPFMVVGSALVALRLGGLTFMSPDSTYVGGVLGPMLLFAFGMGLNFVTLTLTAVSGVAQHEAGAASGLLNVTQQVGGSLGLSILTTVFGSASRDEAEKQLPKFLANGSPEQKAEFAKTHELPAPSGPRRARPGHLDRLRPGRRDGGTGPGHRRAGDPHCPQERPGGPRGHGGARRGLRRPAEAWRDPRRPVPGPGYGRRGPRSGRPQRMAPGAWPCRKAALRRRGGPRGLTARPDPLPGGTAGGPGLAVSGTAACTAPRAAPQDRGEPHGSRRGTEGEP